MQGESTLEKHRGIRPDAPDSFRAEKGDSNLSSPVHRGYNESQERAMTQRPDALNVLLCEKGKANGHEAGNASG
jgi:hypothetical protein